MDPVATNKIGRKLSFLLRHCQNPLYIQLDGGWASVDEITHVLTISKMELTRVVVNDEKQRYSFDKSKTKIRANQGHSIPGVNLPFATPVPPEFLYHGTATRFLDSIIKNGLKPMNRQWVHISKDYDTAIQVGSRHGIPVVLKIYARKYVVDGNILYHSDNGVWLSNTIPPEYFEVIWNNKEEI